MVISQLPRRLVMNEQKTLELSALDDQDLVGVVGVVGGGCCRRECGCGPEFGVAVAVAVAVAIAI
jgi:hypothetical protein